VLRTGLSAEGAERGFNPHHPKDKSYYPGRPRDNGSSL
jgi:hypothetical protein